MGIASMQSSGKLASRITLYNTLFALLACLILAVSTNSVLRWHLTRTAQNELQEVATAVSSSLDLDTVLVSSIQIRAASRFLGADIVVINAAGQVVASSSREFIAGQVLNIPLQQTGLVTRRSPFQAANKQYVYAIVQLTSQPGYVVAISENEELAAIARSIMSIFIPISVVVVLGGSFFGGLWTNRISRPLRQLEEAAHSIARGEFKAPPDLGGDDEIGELSRALRGMVTQLQASELAQRQFVQNASHELKTPLMNIQGYAEAIREGIYTGEDVNHCLEVIDREASGMRRLVDDMIYLSKITGPGEKLVAEPVVLSDLLLAATESTQGIAMDRGLQLVVEPPPEVTITADFDKLVRALTNLIANACRYARSQITVAVYLEQSTVTIEVRDDGPGVEESLLPRVFERFSKGSAGQSGLGLAIVQAIVDGHGGCVSVHNDHGAVFSLRLPRSA